MRRSLFNFTFTWLEIRVSAVWKIYTVIALWKARVHRYGQWEVRVLWTVLAELAGRESVFWRARDHQYSYIGCWGIDCRIIGLSRCELPPPESPEWSIQHLHDMALNPRCYALSQISFLVTSITKKNYKFNSSEITSVNNMHRHSTQLASSFWRGCSN